MKPEVVVVALLCLVSFRVYLLKAPVFWKVSVSRISVLRVMSEASREIKPHFGDLIGNATGPPFPRV